MIGAHAHTAIPTQRRWLHVELLPSEAASASLSTEILGHQQPHAEANGDPRLLQGRHPAIVRIRPAVASPLAPTRGWTRTSWGACVWWCGGRRGSWPPIIVAGRHAPHALRPAPRTGSRSRRNGRRVGGAAARRIDGGRRRGSRGPKTTVGRQRADRGRERAAAG